MTFPHMVIGGAGCKEKVTDCAQEEIIQFATHCFF